MSEFNLGQRVWISATVTFESEPIRGTELDRRVMVRHDLNARHVGFVAQRTTRYTGNYTPWQEDASGHLVERVAHKVYLVAMDVRKPPVLVLPGDIQDYFE